MITEGTPPTPGTAENPWRVGTTADFVLVGVGDCGDTHHYRQVDDFDVDPLVDLGDSRNFFGVYDGDHHTITLINRNGSPDSRPSLFGVINDGVVKKLRVGGNLRSSEGDLGGIVRLLLSGGVLSEIKSTVRIEASGFRIGGLAGVAQGLIQYSSFSGAIVSTREVSGSVSLGGIVGDATGGLIRDSYSAGSIRLNSIQGSTVRAGGLAGRASGGGSSLPTFVRTYSATSYQQACTDNCATTVTGGLVGIRESGTPTQFVSSFWLLPAGDAIGDLAGGGVQPAVYASNLPVAVPLTSTELRQIGTYQTKEDGSSGRPGGAMLAEDPGTRVNTTSPVESDYRWAIESDRTTFVAQRRPESATTGPTVGESVDFSRAFNRSLWSSSPVPAASYSVRGQLQTTPADSYPSLGRVWEICDDSFPVLVWEEESCGGDGDGGDGGNTPPTRDRDRGTDAASLALAAGLSGAELQAFLASGLTLEEWLARRLAQTGTPANALQGGLLAAGMLALIGVWLVTWSRQRPDTT